MGRVLKFQMELDGWIGGPGVNTFYACAIEEISPMTTTDVERFAGLLWDAYLARAADLANSVLVRTPVEVSEFDVATGRLEKIWTITARETIAGTGATANVSRATQICVRGLTDGVLQTPRGGRRVQGRIFLGPVQGNVMDASGQISDACRTGTAEAFGGIIDINDPRELRWVIWSKPKDVVQPGGTVTTRAGQVSYVQTITVNRTPGTLRSRKI